MSKHVIPRRIVLERSVSVGCWRVVGQIAKTGKRTELMPVLLRAEENGGTNAKDVAEHLLFESQSRRIVAERLLGIATAYGLLERADRVFVLTEAGKQAIDAGEVFVPEDGAWTLWASDDPALPSPSSGSRAVERAQRIRRDRRKEAEERGRAPVRGTAGLAASGRGDAGHARHRRRRGDPHRSHRERSRGGRHRSIVASALERRRRATAALRNPGRWAGRNAGQDRSEGAGHFARPSLAHAP